MELDANDLLLFARVADAGSFSAAALRLGLPKSTVSRRIAALEQRLGERLLQRSTRRLSITEFGQGVLAHARALTGEVEAAQALAQHHQAQPSGRLRVSMPADFAAVVLPRMLARFVQDPGRHRGGDERRGADRRRHAAAQDAGHGGARELHARHERAAQTWFRRGLESGGVQQCNTFDTRTL